jgi:hypothetical protein
MLNVFKSQVKSPNQIFLEKQGFSQIFNPILRDISW